MEDVLHTHYAISVQPQLSDFDVIVESFHSFNQIALQLYFPELVQWAKPLYLFDHILSQFQLLNALEYFNELHRLEFALSQF